MNATSVFVGIDVSKAYLDSATRPGGQTARDPNDAAGIAALIARLKPRAPALIVVEATGGLELPLLAALQVAGIAVAAINPRPARDFAKAVGPRAKTDRIDAQVLAHFAEAIRPTPRPLAAPEVQALDALLSRRQQLIEMRVMEANRLAACSDPVVRGDLKRHLAWLEGESAAADRCLTAAVRESPALACQGRAAAEPPRPGAGRAADAAGRLAGVGDDLGQQADGPGRPGPVRR